MRGPLRAAALLVAVLLMALPVTRSAHAASQSASQSAAQSATKPAAGFSAGHAAPELEPGVPQSLARWRAQRYRDVHYAVSLELVPNADRVRGQLALELTLPTPRAGSSHGKGALPDLILDWRPTSPQSRLDALEVNGRATELQLVSEHLVVPARALRPGRNRITLAFEAPVQAAGSAITRYRDREDGAEYLYTLFVPSDASTVFPCFDQPDLKARFTLELSLPEGWSAVSNSPVAKREGARVRFAQTPPLSTYLFAFAAGPFEAITAGDSNLPSPAGEGSGVRAAQRTQPGEAVPATRLYVRRSRLARAQAEAPEVLRLNRAALEYYARFFGHPYPFSKYDLVLIPEFPYGGMEHAAPPS